MSVETIALNKLSAWKGNVRKTAITEGLDELKASIQAHGLLNPLTVQKGDKGEREVIAGQRRLLALRALQKEGAIPADHPVPCTIVSSETDATQVSLAENVVRSQMHPADQFEAFRDLIDKGSGIGEIAARFGVSEDTVTKRLKLGRVSPRLLDVYRRGEMSLEQVAALTLTDDHAIQEAVWNDARGWQREPRELRRALTSNEIAATDSRVKFIGGIEKYEAAGGKVRRDLFDTQNAGYICDLTLLNSLVVATLEKVAVEVRSEGWKWVEIMPEFDWATTRDMGRVYEGQVALTEEQEKRLSELGEKYDELAAEAEEAELTPEQEAKLAEVETEIETLQSRQKIYRSEDIAKAGAFVSIGYRGEPEIRRGWVKSEDKEPQEEGSPDSRFAKPAPDETGIPASLIEDVTAQRTAAMRAELSKRPSLALATTVYTLAVSKFRLGSQGSSLKLSLNGFHIEPLIKDKEQSLAYQQFKAESPLLSQLPTDEQALWRYCLDQSDRQLMALLAVFVSHGIDAIDYKSGAKACPHAHQLADALGLDMTKHFKPTAETYFSRLPKVEIIKALVEMEGQPVSPATEKLKKGALAELAERTYEATGCKWLPEVLRSGPTMSSAVENEAEDEADQIEDAA